MPINNILIVDDHPIVREGLAVVLSRFMGEEVECIQCDSVEKLTSMLNHDIRHDLYILDLEFPKSDIFPVLGRICRQFPDSKILIYSMHDDSWILSHIDPSMIDGFVSKGESMDILLEAEDKRRRRGFQRSVSGGERHLHLISGRRRSNHGAREAGALLSLQGIYHAGDSRKAAHQLFHRQDPPQQPRKETPRQECHRNSDEREEVSLIVSCLVVWMFSCLVV